MEHAQKMYLVDKRQLESLTARPSEVGDIRIAATRRLDAEMQAVLNRSDLSDHDKATLYSDILFKYLNHTRQSESEKKQLTLHLPPTDPLEADATNTSSIVDPVVTDTIDTLAPSSRPNAQLVLRRMALRKDVASWNDRGEFVYRGNVVRGSNMYDLLKALTHKQRPTTANTPNGWEEFTQAFADLNIPSVVAGNASLRRRLETLKTVPPAPPLSPTRSITPPPPTPYEIWHARGFKTKRVPAPRTYDGPDTYDHASAYAKVKHTMSDSWLRY